jgi:hypothetical protein
MEKQMEDSTVRKAETATHKASNAFANMDKQSSVMRAGAETGSRPGDVSKFPTPTSNADNLRTMDRNPPADWLK